MLLLALDRSTATASAAVFRDGALAGASSAPARLRGDCDVAALAAAALGRAGAGFGELDAFACGLGPGSFSGIRAALAFLDGLALPAGTAVTGVPSSAALAWAHLRGAAPGAAACVVGDARRDTLWLARHARAAAPGGTLRETSAPAALPVGEVVGCLAAEPDAIVLSPEWSRLDAALAGLPAGRLRRAEPPVPLAQAVGELALAADAPRVVPPLPLYLHPAVRGA